MIAVGLSNYLSTAMYAQSVLSSITIPSATIQAASQMILSTKTHWTEANNRDCQILLDAWLVGQLPSPAVM
jgi:predicted metal-dependent HD superfamily phosphohydrolase